MLNPAISCKKQIITLGLSVMALMVLALMPDQAQAIQCYECHGTSGTADYRPLDASYRNISTGGVVGNHRTHMAYPASPNECTKCHGNAGYLASHRNDKLDFSANINTSPATGQYKVSGVAVTFKNHTSVPVLGTCSNVNCHFEAVTPQWGTANFASPADCNKCHGAPPSGGTSGAAGSHTKHDTYYTGVTNCQKCHSNNTTFQHATSAAHRNLNISFAAAPNNGSGAYSGALNDYLPSQVNAFGTCRALYCHSNGARGFAPYTSNTTATWGTPLPANCTGCHSADNASGNIMATGSHGKHVNAANLNTIACNKCHAATVSGSMAIIDNTAHVNAKVNIKFNSLTTAVNGTYASQATPYAKDPGTAFGQCSNVYCHSSVQSGADGTAAPTYSTPTWGSAGTGSCGTCHAEGPHSFGATIATGSHTKHLAQSYSGMSSTMKCTICHNIGGKTLTLGASCDSTFCHNAAAAKHANGLIEVQINPYYGATGTYNGSSKPRAGFNTCSNIGCHYSTATPVWGTATPINCVGCHTLAILLASGAHAKHISATAIPTMYTYTANRSTPTEYNFGCSNCHPVSSANHFSGTINVTLNKSEAGVGTLRSKNSATAAGIGIANSGIIGTSKTSVRCTMAYCHSNGNASSLVYATTPDWYGGSFTGDRCANCHGNAPNSTIAGSKSHYNTKFLGYTSTAGGHQTGIHAMAIYSSPKGLAKAGTSGDSSHGNAATATTISCNICHYATVTTARNDDNYVCKTCHYVGNTVGALTGNKAAIADKSKHVNGVVDVSFKPIAVLSKAQVRSNYFTSYSGTFKRNIGYKVSGAYDSAKTSLNTATMWDSSTKTCSNVACHNGQSVKWSDNDGVTTCVSCHNAM